MATLGLSFEHRGDHLVAHAQVLAPVALESTGELDVGRVHHTALVLPQPFTHTGIGGARLVDVLVPGGSRPSS